VWRGQLISIARQLSRSSHRLRDLTRCQFAANKEHLTQGSPSSSRVSESLTCACSKRRRIAWAESFRSISWAWAMETRHETSVRIGLTRRPATQAAAGRTRNRPGCPCDLRGLRRTRRGCRCQCAVAAAGRGDSVLPTHGATRDKPGFVFSDAWTWMCYGCRYTTATGGWLPLPLPITREGFFLRAFVCVQLSGNHQIS